VNGEQRMRVNTRDQIWKLPDILDTFSRHIRSSPATCSRPGRPAASPWAGNASELFLKPGDVVECSIEGVATLRTYIVSPGAAH